MCKTKMAVNASEPTPTRRAQPSQSTRTRFSQSPRTPSQQTLPPFTTTNTTSSAEASTSNTSSANYTTTSSSVISSRTSLSSLRESISQNPHIYDISEIRAATNNFLAKRFSTTSWRCNLRNSDTIIFQRKFRRKIEMHQIKNLLSVICRSHHGSVIKLLGASISGEYIYLVYEFVKGGNLADCLRNARNPDFTVLSTWMSRMQIASDLASALDYIHNKTGLNLTLVHNHIKSSSVLLTEPHFHAKLCHFGASQLTGEMPEEEKSVSKGEIEEEDEGVGVLRSDSRRMQFEGVRGYMSPEFQATGTPSQKSDVYAFGVVILELLSGEEPFKYKYDRSSGDFVRTSVIETARGAVDGGGDGIVDEGRLRRWMDRRLKDSYPVEVAEKLTRVALECVDVDPNKRPDMGRVVGKISRMYLRSKKWVDSMKFSDQISVSLAAR